MSTDKTFCKTDKQPFGKSVAYIRKINMKKNWVGTFRKENRKKRESMDIRIEKTEKAIKNAFLELRAKKPLEKITVKELCGLACINKSTFYSHYEDIFALSELMEAETITSVVKNISAQQQDPFREPEVFTGNLYMALLSSNSLISILFSGKEKARLGDCLEIELKKLIWQRYPEYQQDTERNILLSFCIQGCFHAYLNHRDEDLEAVIRVSENVVRNLRPLYFRE